METSPTVVQSPEPSEPVKQSESQVNEAARVKALLAEARNTRDMLVGFRSAIESGSYNGNKMMDLAKGLAFLEAILGQNNAHIKNLQERLEK